MLFVQMLAQAVAAASPEAAATQGVTSYPVAYFTQYQPGNAAEMIARVPGFTFESGSSLRGFEGSGGNVLIDGQRPATKSDDLDQILRRIPASRVERIDIIRGGAPGIDMQGKTVIANVIRKSGGGFRALTAASLNNSEDGRHMAASRFEMSGAVGPRKWELFAFFGKGMDDGFGPGPSVRISPTGVATPVEIAKGEGDVLNGQLTGAFETPMAGGELRLNARLYKDKYKGEELDIVQSTPIVREDFLDIRHADDSEIGGNFTRKLSSKADVEIVALRQTKDRSIAQDFGDGADTGTFDLHRDSSETIGRAVLKYRFSDSLSAEAGGETAINKQDSATAVTSNGAAVALPAANVEVQENRTEAFAKMTWRPTKAWTVDGSLRYERSKLTSDGDVDISKTLQYVKPRLTAAWDISPSTQLRGRVEREVGQLNFNDFVATSNLGSDGSVIAGNPDLDPEQAWVGEAAIEQRFWKSGSLTITYRHFEITDVVDRETVFTPAKVFDRPGNIGDGTKDELAAVLTLPLERFLSGASIRGDITRRWTEVKDPTTGADREISGSHPIDWNLNFTQDIAVWKLSWGVDAYGGWRETYYRYNTIQTTKLNTYVRPFLEWRPKADWNIRFEIPNATARDLHTRFDVYPGPRSQGGSPSVDDRVYKPGRMYYVRVRKTYGG